MMVSSSPKGLTGIKSMTSVADNPDSYMVFTAPMAMAAMPSATSDRIRPKDSRSGRSSFAGDESRGA